MSKQNEIEIINSQQYKGIRVLKNGKTIEFSPEVSQQICTEMISLGTQLVSETGRVTVEYFKTQANMYYGQLNAFISNQTLKSDERKMVLADIEKITDKYVDLINEADDPEKRAELKENYKMFHNLNSKLYMDALAKDAETMIPKKTDLLSGLRKLLSKGN